MTLRFTRWLNAFAVAFALLFQMPPAGAQEIRLYAKKATFGDLRQELNDAIIAKGLVIDFSGNIGGMLERTGADVGSTRRIYGSAEYFIFCSARLSRAMMEAEPANIGFCPYVMFVYDVPDKPGEAVVGYRRPAIAGSDAAKTALTEIDALLETIAKDATR